MKSNCLRRGWVVFCLHDIGRDIGWEPWAADKLERRCAWPQQDRIPVVTFSQGAELMQERIRAAHREP